MKCIAIIPARGGSKRIPRKNIRDFLGKPVIAYSIEAAIQSNLFDEIMVSTDDEQIANVAIQYGAKVPFRRSSKNADDFATTIDVLNEVLEYYRKDLKQEFDLGCCIYPTAPLLQLKHLLKGYEQINEKNLDSVFPIVEFSYTIWRGLELVNGKPMMVWPEYLTSRSQDLRKVYHDAGQWYWINCKRKLSSLYTNNSGSIILEENEVQDIDAPSDWALAELKYKLMHVD